MPITVDTLPDDLAGLKRIIATMAQDALTAQAEIARLKFQLADIDGPSSGNPRRSWRARPSSSSWRLRRCKNRPGGAVGGGLAGSGRSRRDRG